MVGNWATLVGSGVVGFIVGCSVVGFNVGATVGLPVGSSVVGLNVGLFVGEVCREDRKGRSRFVLLA